MKTILQINIVANSGSTGRIAEEIGLTAINNGFDSYIAFGRNTGGSNSKLIKIGNKWDIKLHGLITRIFDKHGFGSKNATIKLIDQIKEIKPDIIHLHNIHGYYLNINILFNYLSIANIPIVWTLHDCWSFTGHCAHFEQIGCNRWKEQCYDCPLKKDYPSSYLLDNSRKNYLKKKFLFNSVKDITFVAVSSWINELHKQSFLKRYPVVTIHNGVNLDVFEPKKNKESITTNLGIKNKFIVLGVLSLWNNSRGFNDFINLSKLIDSETVIVLVGLSQEQIKKLPRNIIGIERTDNINQLVDYYSAADLYMNLTYSDTFPSTNLESLACGTPIVTYKTGGSIEAVSSETGYVVEQGNINSLVDVINSAKAKGKEYFSFHCRQRAIHFFNKNNKFNEYIHLYNEILNKK